ncbi:putative regulatory protein, FmdB family [Magnetococcus marinus MC-1]|uniref:Putative regulatory protein, FmdB family n=1 Tax=Magnetococcus marinus (strain ATCC BAA-1437 / JCM 17883 / MC-1) TaxID=156889 RepID=A0LAG4_MAGMM|nr:zinc ribbon domain-containing protein [Magnetococcus marinus]ABK44957.1 putative regulatory protein, FmdB family [Magnetococcus marinus MC-1]
MPLYDYKCDSCSHTFEVQHRMSETPELSCPKCAASQVRKILSTGGIVGSTKLGQDSAPAPSPCAGGACGMGGGCPIG